METPTGTCVILEPARKTGFCLKARGIYLSSQFDPEAEGRKIFAAAGNTPPGPALFMGLSPVYQIREFAGRCPQTPFMIIEFSPEVFRDRVKLIRELTEKKILSGELACVISRALYFFDQAPLLSFLSGKNDNLKIFENPVYRRYFPEAYQKCSAQILDILDKGVKNITTEKYFSPIWNHNTLKNIFFREKLNSAAEFILNRAGNSCLLIGSGPALVKNPEYLQALSRRVFTMAVPGILGWLLSNDIIPDCLFTTDAGFWNSRHFYAYFYRRCRIPVLTSFSACIPQFTGSCYFFFHDSDYETAVQKKLGAERPDMILWPIIPMQGSVLCAAALLLARAGIKNLYTAGADFKKDAFRAHAVSNSSEEILFSATSRFSPFESLYRPLADGIKKGDLFFDPKLSLYGELFLKAVRENKLNLVNDAIYPENEKPNTCLPEPENISGPCTKILAQILKTENGEKKEAKEKSKTRENNFLRRKNKYGYLDAHRASGSAY